MREFREHIPCDPTIDCKLRETIGCYEDIHHEFHPKSKYRSKLEKAFRSHILNKVLICRALHNDAHATQPEPIKPTVIEMRRLLSE